MENQINSDENKKRRDSNEIKIEDKIHNMLSEVMEEKDSNESFEYDCGEIDDKFDLSRPSTRRQTTQTYNPNDMTDFHSNLSNSTQFLAYPSFNRTNKRNMTHHLNQVTSHYFNKSPHLQIPRKSAQYSNFGLNSLNVLHPNLYNNSFNNNSNLFLFNNNMNNLSNLNQSFQSFQSYNPQFNESFLSNNLGHNNSILGNNYLFNINNNNFNPQGNFYNVNNNINNLMPILNPFKYHPNYNSIYKNIPSFKMIAPKKILLNRDEKSNKKSKEKDKSKEKEKTLITEPTINRNNNLIKTPNKKIKVLNTIGNSSDNAITKAKLKLPALAKAVNYKKIDSINIENSNHALRFSKYIPRKFVIPENNKNISYLNPINYIKPKNKIKSIDFGKMLYRGENNLINTSELKNPSFGQYNPNYACIDKNEHVKRFNPEEKNSESHKKYLMRKLWGSYKVNTEYQLVDNDKI